MNKTLRNMATVLLATVVLASGSGAAWAASQQYEVLLNPGQVTNAGSYDSQDCSGPFAGLESGVFGWHFVLPPGVGDTFVSWRPNFAIPGAIVATPIGSTDPMQPSQDEANDPPQWWGYMDAANGLNAIRDVYVFTRFDGYLRGGIGLVIGEGLREDSLINLQNTCVGTEAPASTSPSPEPTPSNVEPDVTPSTPAGGGKLPTTGSPVKLLLSVGGLLIVLGIGLVVIRARRRLAS